MDEIQTNLPCFLVAEYGNQQNGLQNERGQVKTYPDKIVVAKNTNDTV